jgi:hypothetical protein
MPNTKIIKRFNLALNRKFFNIGYVGRYWPAVKQFFHSFDLQLIPAQKNFDRAVRHVFTQPLTPVSLAFLVVKYRNPTPCTRPWIFRCFCMFSPDCILLRINVIELFHLKRECFYSNCDINRSYNTMYRKCN